MIWSSLDAFFSMGGYAIYVWPSLGMCALLAIFEWMAVRRRHREIVRRLRDQAMADQINEGS